MQPDWKFKHVGFIVRDLAKAVAHYQKLGYVTEGDEFIAVGQDNTQLRGRFMRLSEMEIEFFQPVAGYGMQAAYLDKHGEGIQHLAYEVTDIDKEIAALLAKGYKLIFAKQVSTGSRIAYFDTGDIGDMMTELIQYGK